MRCIVLLAPLGAIALAACDAPEIAREPAGEEPPQANIANDEPRGTAPIPPLVSPVGGVNDGEPDMTPPRLTADAEKGQIGARNVLLAWARAIELKEFDQAWAMMSEADRRKWSKAEFAALFAGLWDIAVAVPDGVMEGAAGSLYYSGRATITAMHTSGRPVRIEVPVVLRRANDVPGATSEQLRWRFHSTDLQATH